MARENSICLNYNRLLLSIILRNLLYNRWLAGAHVLDQILFLNGQIILHATRRHILEKDSSTPIIEFISCTGQCEFQTKKELFFWEINSSLGFCCFALYVQYAPLSISANELSTVRWLLRQPATRPVRRTESGEGKQEAD